MKKTFNIIGIALIAVIMVFGIILFVRNISTDRIVCKSSSGNITIYYDDDSLLRYTTTGKIYYNFENQKAYASKIGIESYIDQFDDWFVNNTKGSCKNKN